jgi:hypothetical protein
MGKDEEKPAEVGEELTKLSVLQCFSLRRRGTSINESDYR